MMRFYAGSIKEQEMWDDFVDVQKIFITMVFMKDNMEKNKRMYR